MKFVQCDLCGALKHWDQEGLPPDWSPVHPDIHICGPCMKRAIRRHVKTQREARGRWWIREGGS